MRVWVDADACPRPIKDIVIRAAERRGVDTVLVANQHQALTPSARVSSVRVAAAPDAADQHIVDALAPGDLVITADVPLAAAVVARGALALNPRGTLYSADNIAECLALRDMQDELRGTGLAQRGGPPPFDQRDRAAFANQFDRVLTRATRA